MKRTFVKLDGIKPGLHGRSLHMTSTPHRTARVWQVKDALNHRHPCKY